MEAERSERVERTGTYATESVSDRYPVLWWLSHGEERDAVT